MLDLAALGLCNVRTMKLLFFTMDSNAALERGPAYGGVSITGGT